MYASALPPIDLNSASWNSMGRWALLALVAHLLVLASAFLFYQTPPQAPDVFNVTMLPMAPPAAEPPAPAPAPKPQPVVKKAEPKPTPLPKPAPVDSKTAISREQPAPTPSPAETQSTAPASGAEKPSQTVSESKPQVDASYLNAPKPVYPAMSRRLGESGRVMLDVYVLPDGTPSKVSVHKTSGYPRLDDSAVEAVKRWRFTPGKRGGEAIAMPVIIPVIFDLNQ